MLNSTNKYRRVQRINQICWYSFKVHSDFYSGASAKKKSSSISALKINNGIGHINILANVPVATKHSLYTQYTFVTFKHGGIEHVIMAKKNNENSSSRNNAHEYARTLLHWLEQYQQCGTFFREISTFLLHMSFCLFGHSFFYCLLVVIRKEDGAVNIQFT